MFLHLSICAFAFITCNLFTFNGNEENNKYLQNDTISFFDLDRKDIKIKGSAFIISRIINLKGKTLIIPSNKTLIFKGGGIKNGVLIGQNTRIKNANGVFENVRIKGLWNVPNISTAYFKNLNYVNSLIDVFSLSNPHVKNKVIIEDGDYFVSINSNDKPGIQVGSNTDILFNGTIRIIPNKYPNYFVLLIRGENIIIKGKGRVVGDKDAHLGTVGEWGMGIGVLKSTNVDIKGISIIDCWGDGIYIGEESENVRITKCIIRNGRRQGISVISAKSVNINNCIISDIGGIAPGCAIDIEPNKGDTVDAVKIDKVVVCNSVGGLWAYGLENNAEIGSVSVKNCLFSSKNKIPVRANGCNIFSMVGCKISQKRCQEYVFLKNIKKVKLYRNSFVSESSDIRNKDIGDSCDSEIIRIEESNSSSSF